MSKHEMLARQIVETIKMTQRLSFLDPCLSLAGAEKDLRRAYAWVQDRIQYLKDPDHTPPNKRAMDLLMQAQARRARYGRPGKLAKILGIG